jgi:translation initiation factor IF-3
LKYPLVNNQIRAREVRVIDETGKQLGVFALEEALRLARERNLDLIQVTEKVDPPVCKIGDYGKYLYSIQKKEKAVKTTAGKIKGVRISFAISPHDLETKVKMAEKFLKKGYRVRVELVLRGREKALDDFAKGKMNQFLENLGKLITFKIERELKREPRGFTMIITKASRE